MINGKTILAFIGVAFAVQLCLAATADFDSYQVIIDRAIFGRRAAPVAAATAQEALDQKKAEQMAKRLTMCAVNRTPSGNVAVGFIDNEAKPPRNIYLNVGDSADGYSIIEADYDAETATIKKDGVVITMKLGQGLVANAATVVPAVAAVTRPAVMTPPRMVVATASEGRGGVAVAPGRPQVGGAPGESGMIKAGQRFGGPGRATVADAGTGGSYRAGLQEREQRQRGLREAEEQAAREKFAELAREVAAAEVRRQVLAEQGLTEEDLLYDQQMSDDMDEGE